MSCQVVRGQHWLHLGSPPTAAKTWRPLMDRLYMPPAAFFTQGTAGGGANWAPRGWWSDFWRDLIRVGTDLALVICDVIIMIWISDCDHSYDIWWSSWVDGYQSQSIRGDVCLPDCWYSHHRLDGSGWDEEDPCESLGFCLFWSWCACNHPEA